MVEYFGDDEEKTPANKKGGDLEEGFTLRELAKRDLRVWDVLTPQQKQEVAEFAAKTPFSLEEILTAVSNLSAEKDTYDR